MTNTDEHTTPDNPEDCPSWSEDPANPAANPHAFRRGVPPQESDLEIMRWFGYDHLPPHLQAVSRPYADLAQALTASIPHSQELAVALRKLLESKDAAVRAAMAGLDRFKAQSEHQ